MHTLGTPCRATLLTINHNVRAAFVAYCIHPPFRLHPPALPTAFGQLRPWVIMLPAYTDRSGCVRVEGTLEDVEGRGRRLVAAKAFDEGELIITDE